MPERKIQVYECTDTRCRYIDERAEQSPKWRYCPKCGKQMRSAGERTLPR